MPINRRKFLQTGLLAGAGLTGATMLSGRSGPAHAAIEPGTGAMDITQYGVSPGANSEQNEALQSAIDDSARLGMPLFLPPGRYLAAGIKLRNNTALVGVPGQTRIIFSGGEFFLRARASDRITFDGLAIGSGGNDLTGNATGLVEFNDCTNVILENCILIGSNRNGLSLDKVSGRVRHCEFGHHGGTGIFSVNARGMELASNHVHTCGNNGIQVWRAMAGQDGTIVTQNRIEGIDATLGGSGEFGNGINLFRAKGVQVVNNQISDCAFSAVRANAASNCQINGNSCSRLGEVALYSEFGFEGAMVSNNLVDEAAAGISITNFNEGGRLAVCNGNIIRNLTNKRLRGPERRWGFGIAVEADTVVNANVVEGAPYAGLMLGWGSHLRDVTATGNVIREAGMGIAISVANGAGSAIVSDNLLSNVRDGAIRGLDLNAVVTGDLATSGADDYPQLVLARNQVN